MSERSLRRARERELEREERRGARLARRAGAVGGATLGAAVLFASPADAATFTVNSLEDPGDGTCDAAECTLREAVGAAEAAAGADVVTFASGLSGAITLTEGQIEVSEELSIQGPGAGTLAVDGNDASRIFYSEGDDESELAFTISGLTLRDGAEDDGGAVYADDTRLAIVDSVLTGNDASSVGGAVYATDGSFTLERSIVSDNTSNGYGGGVDVEDNDAGDVVIRDSRISGNTAENGGGIMLYDLGRGGEGTDSFEAFIQRTTISGNTATEDGGGVYIEDAYETDDGVAGGSVTITDSTISGNTAAANGGGLTDQGGNGSVGEPVTIRNTTVSGNTAGGDGGGLYLDDDDDLTTTLANSTVAGNAAEGRGGGLFRQGDDEETTTESLSISSTIVADNTAPEGPDLADPDPPAEGTIVLGFSLVENPGSATRTSDPDGSNIFGAAPQIGPLADNGGPTLTHLPDAGSPAVDAGVANGLAADQRGLPRTVDVPDRAQAAGSDATDIGATERQNPAAPPPPPPADPPPPAATPPETAITGGPRGLTGDGTPTFRFTSPTAGATFECRVDSRAFSACTTPFTTRRLSDGRHRFQVRASAGGATDPTPATRTFTVDTRGPRVGISGSPTQVDARGGIRRRLTCPASEPVSCTGTLTLRQGGQVLGRARFRLADGASRVVRVQLSRDDARRLRRQGSVRVVATARARDTVGNRGTTTRRFLVRGIRAAAPRFTG